MSDSRQDQLDADSSISTFTSALWFNAALGIGFFGAFLILRKTRPQTYSPRTYATPIEKRPPTISNGTVKWMWDIFQISDDELIRTMGLDRFMILKFLRMGLVTFFTFSLLAIPILFPLNIINQLDSPGLNLLTIGNIRDSNRTWAHVVLSMVLTGGLIYYTFYETRKYLVLRRAYLMSDEYRNSVMARTLYVPSIPKDVNTVDNLKRIFSKFPGGVRHVWLNRDLKDLPDQVGERQQNVCNLETVITKVILASYKHSNKENLGQTKVGGEEGGFVIPQKLRPTHRVKPGFLPFGLPFVGRKVDSIDFYNDEIARLNEEIQAKQRGIKNLHQRNSAFIEFHYQSAAQMAAQTLIHHTELQMAPRYIQIAPSDIIWENMNIKSFERLIRRMVSISVTTAIIIFWAIPVVFVQSISSLDSLSKILPFLSAVNNMGPTAVGIIQGILPAVALAILISLVPIIFTYLSKLEGIPQKSFVDLSVLHKYFFFQFIDVVLVSTIAGGILQTLPQLIENPTTIINILAENLPKASTFFITFVMLQATNSTGQAILQLVPYLLSFVMPIFSTTPRDIYKQKTTLPGISIGTLIPSHSVIFVLGIEYSTIAPLILPFVILFFCLNYFVYLYQFLYVYEMEYETGGRAFPRSIRHIYIGMFTWQLTMIGLMAVRGNEALGQLVVMIIVLCISIGALVLYDKSFKPLFKYLPMDSFEDNETDITLEPAHEHGYLNTLNMNKNADHVDNKAKVQHMEMGSEGHGTPYSTSPSTQDSSDNNGNNDAGTTTATQTAGSEYVRQRINGAFPEKTMMDGTTTTTNKEEDVADAEILYHQILSKLTDQVAKHHQHQEPDHDNAKDPVIANAVSQLYATEAYMHPAAYDTQPPVWLPQDELGITDAELAELKTRKIYALDSHATAFRNKQEKGKVEIDEQTLIVEQKGVPGSLPAPGTHLSYFQNYVRTVVDNVNFFAAMGGNGNFLATAFGG
ncbi:hypothetical protein BCR42DRAFT_455829 [Absidia repens]|uniref:DUF221-domain-containing protein n=1 Tax=Absidia repens TaxID=90262 RepID=A0A1X2I2Q3_9FUNG|nr:hypothetical protein BCR42DRAFT_455829 [Absidia repens]